jgi:chromosomal replication initiator protein
MIAIDDIDLFGKPAQKKLIQMIERFTAARRQIILAARAAPEDAGLEDRLEMRAGLAIGIEPPDEQARAKILRAAVAAKAAGGQRGFAAAMTDDIIAALAARCSGNAWMLNRAVDQICAAYHFGSGIMPTVESALAIASGVLGTVEKPVWIEDIQRAVASHFKIGRLDLLSQRRTANVVRPRQIAMYLAKIMTSRSLPEIGRRFGNRDHTTVLHGVQRIEELIERDEGIADDVAAIKLSLAEKRRS